MKVNQKRRAIFPSYLKQGTSTSVLRWLGKHLEQERIRSKKDVNSVAGKAGVSVKQIRAIEKGDFAINLGVLRDILRIGYDLDFERLLAECYEANREELDPKHEHLFERDYHYSLCREGGGGRYATGLLVGGDAKKYLWATRNCPSYRFPPDSRHIT